MTTKESICVYDFSGSAKYLGYSEPVSMWGDYYPAEKKTVFGGAWHDAPDLISDVEPTEDQIEAHAEIHSEWQKQSTARRKKDREYLAKLNS